MAFYSISLIVILLLFSLTGAAIIPSLDSLKSCSSKCGNITVTYPFGFADGCYRRELQMFCDTSYNPPKLFPFGVTAEVTSINSDVIVLEGFVAKSCYIGFNLTKTEPMAYVDLRGFPRYSISSVRNKYMGIGCDVYSSFSTNPSSSISGAGCQSSCSDKSEIINGSCSGYGCCQNDVPKGTRFFLFNVGSVWNHTKTWEISPCSFSFLADQERFEFHVDDVLNFYKRKTVPFALDWNVGNETCQTANSAMDYACGENSHCINSVEGTGYRCLCNNGYQGNPYFSDGCKDIDECKKESSNDCSNICTNALGSYNCCCPTGTFGDGRKSGSGCLTRSKSFPLLQVILDGSLGFLLLVISASSLYWMLKRRRLSKIKRKFFKQNGGLLLQQEITSHKDAEHIAKIFTSDELKKATLNYHKSRILGKGGFGTVYKGILSDKRLIAIKKPNQISNKEKFKEADANQSKDFINEIVILSQLEHRNVVRIVGCCFETRVPLLVYEFMPNGTLSSHLYGERHGSLSWESRLRIAFESASAIAYLHHSISQPVLHRDIKPANILLDENYTAKVSDFGLSRMLAIGRDELDTLANGTFGYLDPEFIQTSIISTQSDVYSFGVVLVELIMGQMPFKEIKRKHNYDDDEPSTFIGLFFQAMEEHASLLEILEPRVKDEAKMEHLQKVADIAFHCLRRNGHERPTMREVASELQKLRNI